MHNPARFLCGPVLQGFFLLASLAVAPAAVVINEIHYNPDIKTERVEFVELHNTGSGAVDLGGWTFNDAITYTFPSGTSLPAGGYLVVSENTNSFRLKFGFTSLGPWMGNLNNFGERIVLRNAAGQLVDEVEYQLGFPWPTVGDPPGSSIELANPAFDNNLGGNWRAAGTATSSGTEPTTITLIPERTTWKYLKGTSEASTPTTAWRQTNYNDTPWLTGAAPVGYGESFLATTLSDMNGGYVSVFFRKTFVATNVTAFDRLILEAQYDDGFKAWINGVLVIDGNANMPVGEVAYNAGASTAIENLNYVTFSLANVLVEGTNVLAVQAHNSSISGSSDFFFDARLIGAQGGSAGPTLPTPGRVNTTFTENLPPQIRQVDHRPEQPMDGQVVRITAKITDPETVTNVTLLYQFVDPGAYIEITDAAYTNNWTALEMNDRGVDGDEVAGDDIYTVELPGSAQVHRRLVRYRLSAADATGLTVRVPYADDPQPNFAYFVYNGVPEWRGALQQGGTAVTFGTNVMRRLPVYHLISKKSSVETGTWFERYNGDLYKWNGTLVYDGKVYDHIRYRARGGVWRYAMVKNMWKFDFNRGHDFEPRDNWGKKFAVPWRKLNLGASIQQADFYHRGEQGMFESVGFKLFNLAGVESPNTAFVQFRIIDEAAESYPNNQYEGDFWGVYLAVEQEDGRFLEAHDLPDGNFYKMEGGTGEANNLGPAGPTDKSDLNYFLSAYNNASEAWWRTNLDLGRYYSYQAIVQAIHHYDICYDKNFFYLRHPQTGLWSVHSWDLDLTWADNMYDANCGGIDRIKQRMLNNTFSRFELEWRNRIREIRDLLFNTDQTYRIIDEYAWLLRGSTNGPTILDADRYMWDYNPKMSDSRYSSTLSKAGTGLFYQFPQESLYLPAGARNTFNATLELMRRYVTVRSTILDNLAADNTLPSTPVVTATCPPSFPLNRLTFRASNYSGVNPFAAMQWRIAEITPTNVPVSTLTLPAKYEITSVWESGEMTSYNSDITIPSSTVKAGDTYRVRVRFKDTTGRWSRWSAPVQFVCGVPDTAPILQAHLRLSELMFNSPAGSEYDFVELHNTSAETTLDLNGAKFTQGIDYTFGAGAALPPLGYLVLVKTTNHTAFRAYYGLSTNMALAGPYGGNFSDSGEQVTLRTAAGGSDLVSFQYSDGRGWPPAADGSGHSLVPREEAVEVQATGGLSYPGNWRASTYLKGSPGAADPEAPVAPLLNEIVSHTDFTTEWDSNDWIELYNPATNEFTFGPGWYLSDHPTNLTKWMIPAGTVIPAQGWIAFDEQTGFHNPTNIGFGLSKGGETVFLSYLAGTLQDRVVDAIAMPGQENEWSLGRYPDGGAYWQALSPRTRAAANAVPPLAVRISEIMYHPPELDGITDNSLDEYLELYNPMDTPVTLADSNGTWRINGGIELDLPGNLVLAPHDYLLVVNFSPTNAAQSNAFRATYGITRTDLAIVGPYAGKLGNDTERVTLEKRLDPQNVTNNVAWAAIDEIIYADQFPFEIAADGFGPSLHRQSMTHPTADPANWRAAASTPGGPYLGGIPPMITEQPGPVDRTSPAGALIIYSVAATGTGPLAYQWRRDGNNIPGATASVLTLENVQPSASGEYSVLILNSAGSLLSRSVRLFVTTPPQIVTQPRSSDLRPGSNVTFTVTATGIAPLQYQWRQDGIEIPFATNSSYSLTDVQLPDEGAYTVVVSDINGLTISDPAVLRILISPVILQQPLSQSVVMGGDVTFSVTISGSPMPFGYEWRKVSTPLASNTLWSTTSFFTLTNVQPAMAGNYRVVIRNPARPSGLVSANATLTVLADSDHDGMPDDWETTYNLGTNAPDADLDADGDTMTNLAEYQAGTDPKDPLSYLRVEDIQTDFDSTGAVRLSFLARTNLTYTLHYRDALLPGSPWTRLADVVAAPSNYVVEITDQPSVNVPRRFYRITTPRDPGP